MKQPNELSFKKAKIRLYTQTFCYEAKSGKDKATSKRFARTSTRIRHDGLIVNLIVILRISVMLII